jgi:hypothetical protein
MTVQLYRPTGELLAEQTLPPGRAGIWLLTLPGSDREPLVWESFPSCQPNKPPTRTFLESGPALEREATAVTAQLAAWRGSCGGEVATAPLLQAFGLEDYRTRLPLTLPIHCQTLTGGTPAAPLPPGSESRP